MGGAEAKASFFPLTPPFYPLARRPAAPERRLNFILRVRHIYEGAGGTERGEGQRVRDGAREVERERERKREREREMEKWREGV